MNLVIEAGGTKTNLAFIKNGEVVSCVEQPAFNLSRMLSQNPGHVFTLWSSFAEEPPEKIFVFAAGAKGAAIEKTFKEEARKVFSIPTENIYLHTDLLAACYALAGDEKGIVGIMGTGSNSCFYDGEEIRKNVSPGGFILGDEGSGAAIGKDFLIHYLRGEVPLHLKNELDTLYHLSYEHVIQQVYGSTVQQSVAFISGFAKNIIEKKDDPWCRELLQKNIRKYIALVSEQYAGLSSRLYLAGSVAWHLQSILREQASLFDLDLVKVIQHPIQDLSLFLIRKHAL